MNVRVATACVTALILVGPAPIRSQDALDRLLHAKSLQCKFHQGASASWDKGRLLLELTKFGEGGAIVFDSINTKTGKARLIGNAAAGDVNVLLTPTLLTFVESTDVGNINITSVFRRSHTTVDGEFVAVTSRHVDILGPAPSQYHGTCRVFD